MVKTKFGRLSSLVLVDVAAALPLEQVLRLARLGHGRLRQTCSLEWVTERMTDVRFELVVKARLADHSLGETFSSEVIMKRLNGRVTVDLHRLQAYDYKKNCKEILSKTVGKLHLHILEGKPQASSYSIENLIRRIESVLSEDLLTRIVSVMHGACLNFLLRSRLALVLPNLVWEFQYFISPDSNNPHEAMYRPALMNGRNIVDVLRAGNLLIDLSEAQLAYSRAETTNNSCHLWSAKDKNVWFTHWYAYGCDE